MAWQPIKTARKDGKPVYVKRVYKGKIVKEGIAVWGICSDHAPQRAAMDRDPLGRISEAEYAAEHADILDQANTAKWLTSDKMYSFPEPTHWHTEKTPNR